MAMVPYATEQAVGIVSPLVNPAAARQAIQQYEALKAAIVQPSDIQRIQGRDFLKKAFWRRVATCFGLSLDLVSEQRGHDEKGSLYYSVIYRAIAPNGRTMTADGYCSTSEPGRVGWPEHNVRATAHTRAKNRAISDLVGGGEVSADEVPEYVEEAPAPVQRQVSAPTPVQPTRAVPQQPARPVPPTSASTSGKPSPAQVKLISDLCEKLGEELPTNLTAQNAGKTIFEMNKRLRERSVPRATVTEEPGFPEGDVTEDNTPDLSTLDFGRGA